MIVIEAGNGKFKTNIPLQQAAILPASGRNNDVVADKLPVVTPASGVKRQQVVCKQMPLRLVVYLTGQIQLHIQCFQTTAVIKRSPVQAQVFPRRHQPVIDQRRYRQRNIIACYQRTALLIGQ